jgi:hypothetical protein
MSPIRDACFKVRRAWQRSHLKPFVGGNSNIGANPGMGPKRVFLSH